MVSLDAPAYPTVAGAVVAECARETCLALRLVSSAWRVEADRKFMRHVEVARAESAWRGMYVSAPDAPMRLPGMDAWNRGGNSANIRDKAAIEEAEASLNAARCVTVRGALDPDAVAFLHRFSFHTVRTVYTPVVLAAPNLIVVTNTPSTEPTASFAIPDGTASLTVVVDYAPDEDRLVHSCVPSLALPASVKNVAIVCRNTDPEESVVGNDSRYPTLGFLRELLASMLPALPHIRFTLVDVLDVPPSLLGMLPSTSALEARANIVAHLQGQLMTHSPGAAAAAQKSGWTYERACDALAAVAFLSLEEYAVAVDPETYWLVADPDTMG